ncbi:hypothetical protein E1286_17970 [Nonomuraea terrae]|uniref:Uncharacterized protein n=1 Tax=Nonomuraea terrae TaxID=2530383 RepID=A0A4R4YRN9_9ACTN|nr:hypothetical protein [Nonomuraea terrae]TDD47290.1 hypothetical protein E1286_17970 [Nonomuraea terrae]
MISNRPGDGPAEDLPAEEGRFHSAHVPDVPGCTELDWEPVRNGGYARVRAYTCDCQPTFYELCYAHGQAFIRRTRRMNGKTLIDECAHGRPVKTLAVWAMLLAGAAR